MVVTAGETASVRQPANCAPSRSPTSGTGTGAGVRASAIWSSAATTWPSSLDVDPGAVPLRKREHDVQMPYRIAIGSGWVDPADPFDAVPGDGGAEPEQVWMYLVVSVLDRDRYGRETAAAWTAGAKLRSGVSPGPGLRNRDPAYVSGPLPEPVRRGARP
jgi:hypothetical protein